MLTPQPPKKEDKLRRFADWEDLVNDEEIDDVETQVVEWLAELRNYRLHIASWWQELEILRERAEKQKRYHRRQQEKNKILQKIAREQLAPDEIAALARQIEEKEE